MKTIKEVLENNFGKSHGYVSDGLGEGKINK